MGALLAAFVRKARASAAFCYERHQPSVLKAASVLHR